MLGNEISGDGCNACRISQGYECYGEPSYCSLIAAIREDELPLQSSDKVPIIVGSTLGGIFFLLLFLLGFFILVRRNGSSRKPHNELAMEQINIIGSKEIILGQLLGSGQFGQVFKGTWNGTPVV